METSQIVTVAEPGGLQLAPRPRGLGRAEGVVMTVASLLVLAASYLGWWTIAVTEAWGFATGGVCVWLVVREHLWNWPIGLANNVVFFVLFFQGRCDLYLLTGDEIPFVQDGLRDGEHIRHEMHHWFEEALAAQPVPWGLLRGSPEARLAEALRRVEGLFAGSAWKPAAGAP